MKTMVTGLNGTVAPALAEYLRDQGHEVVGWDRSCVRIDDQATVAAYVADHRPDRFFHVATGPPDWAEHIARACAGLGIPLVVTSSVSVFAPDQPAPLTPDTEPRARDDYGRYKREVELRMGAAHPDLVVARLAWQIGPAPGSNTMTDHLERTARERGRIEASTQWYPACAFLEDTAAALVELAAEPVPGTYHLDGNPGLSFHAIAAGLARAQGRAWTVVAVDEPVADNRMSDPRVTVAPITGRLGAPD